MVIDLITAWAVTLIPLIIGATIGLTIADIDLAPPLPVSHRSAWTHGPFFALAGLLAIRVWPYDWLYWLILGLLPAYALHLCFDMFPKEWRGIAKISLAPVPLRLPIFASFSYLGISALISLYSASWLAPGDIGGLIFLGIIAWAGWGYFKKEKVILPGVLFLSLALLSHLIGGYFYA